MSNMKLELSESEKLARNVTTIEGDSTFFESDNKSLDRMIENRNRELYNDRVQETIDKYDDYNKKLQEYADNFAHNLQGVEIVPINAGVLVQPYEENPFQKVKISDSGIIYDQGGKRAEFKNSDTGEMEEAEQYIKVGVVVEASPACKFVKTGDTVMWNLPTQIPIPFYSMGLVLVNEQHIMCVINEGLTERFKNYGK